MEPRANYTIVGTVVVGLIATAVVVVLWFAQGGSADATRPYLILFQKQSVAGLQKDGPVTMRGITVGRVKTLRISQKDVEIVRVLVAIDQETPIKTDTRAIIQRNILTGLAGIDLVNSTENAPNLVAGPDDEFAIIPEGESQIDQIASSLPKLLDETGVMLRRINEFLSPANQAAVSKALANIETVTASFTSDTSELGELIRNITVLSSSVNAAVKDFQGGGNQVLRELAAALEIITLQLRDMGREFNHSSRAVTSMIETYQDPRALIAGPSEQSLGPGEAP